MPKFNNIENIPAKTFFDILETKNFRLLKPKPREKGLEQVFMSLQQKRDIHLELCNLYTFILMFITCCLKNETNE